MNAENYITIQGWMRTELNLKGNDLMVYAIIYGFCQTEGQKFTGSLQYLADWCGATKAGIQKNLKKLMELNLIEKEDIYINNVKFCHYKTKLHRVCNKVTQGMKQSCIYNIDNNIKDKIEKSNTKVLLEETSSSQDKDFLNSSKKPKKQNKYEKCVSMIDDFTSDSKIRKLLIQYLNMRLEIKDKPMYANQWKGMLNKLKDMDNIQDVIQQSIDRGYLGFFPVKKYQSAYNDRDKFCEPENYKTRIYEGEEKEKAEAFRERMRKQGKQVTF